MTIAYPRKLTPPYGAFLSADPPAVIKPDPSDDAEEKRPTLKLTFTVSDSEPLPVAEQPRLIGVTRVVLFVDGAIQAEACSTSFNNGDQSKKDKDIHPFCFCPGVDAVRIGWKMRNEQAIAKATIEIHAARLDGPICKKEISGAALTKDPKTEGTEAPLRCTGSILLRDAMTWTGTHDAAFPDQVLTAEHSPYQVRVIVEKKPEGQLGATDKKRALYPSTAWSFFHVLVDHLELEWGTKAKIPAGGPPSVAGPFAAETENLEKALYDHVAATAIAGQTIDLANHVRQVRGGQRPPVPKIELPLLVHQFDAEKPFGGEPKIDNNHDAIVKVWGDGPRIPLRVKAFIRKNDGSAATFNESQPAAGKLRFLWDWSDDPQRWKDWIQPGPLGHSLLSQEMLQRAFAKREAPEPFGSANCPLSFGGRRGAATKPVFPTQAQGTFGYKVTDGQGTPRPWASVSEAGTAANRATSEALFHPSSIPGDQYRIHVYVTGADDASGGGRTGQDDKPDLRRADAGHGLHEDVVDEPSPPAHAPRVPVFEVYRKTPVKIINVGTPLPVPTLNAVAARYKRELHIILDHSSTALAGNWQTANNKLATWKAANLDMNTTSLALRLAFKTQPANFGTHFLHMRTYDEFRNDLPAFLATTGSLVTYSRGGGKHEDYAIPGASAITAGIGIFPGGGSAAPPRWILDGWKIGKSGDRWQYVMLVETGARPANGEAVGGHNVANVTPILAADLEIVRVDVVGAQAANVIKVLFPNTTVGPVTLTYGKKGVRNLVQRSVPKAGMTALKNLFDNLVTTPANVVKAPKFRIEMMAPDPAGDKRDAGRLEKLERELQRLFVKTELFVSPTRLTGAILRSITKTGYYQSVDAKFLRTIKRDVTIDILNVYAGDQGALCVYFDKLSDVDPNASGGAHKMHTTQRRTCLYIIRGTGAITGAAQYDAEAVFGHELLHLLFRSPHAKRMVFGFDDVGGGEEDHLPYDGCLMSYDAEPSSSYFCAYCMLGLRGWVLDNPTKMAPGGPAMAHARTLLDQQIGAPGLDGRAKAWFLHRKAHLAWKQNILADAESAALAALTTWERAPGVDWSGPDRVSMLRATILALKAAGNVDRAFDLRKKLELLTDYGPDFKGFNDDLTGGSIQRVDLLEDGGAAATEAVKQFVNLPREARFVDGAQVASLDRLGRTVRVKVVFADPGRQNFTVQLLGHIDNEDYTDDERRNPLLNYHGANVTTVTTRPDYSLSYAASVAGRTDGDGTKIVELELPPTGANSYIVAATAADGTTVESFPIDAERLLFMQRVICTNAAADVPAAQAFVDKLNESFVPSGVRIAHVGDANLAGHAYLDSRDTFFGPFFNAATVLAGGASTWNGQTFAALRPHLFQVIFAKQVLGAAEFGRLTRPNTTGGATVNLTVKDRTDALSTLWLGEPPGHESVAVNAGNRAHYLGDGSPKRWLLWGGFNGQDLQLGDVTGVEDDGVNTPGKCTKIDVNLGRFLATDVGLLTVQVLTTRWVGGVSLKSEWQIAIASRPPFAAAGDPIDKQVAKVVHELGHLVGMVPRYFTAASGMTLAPGPSGVDGPSTWYSLDGSHCCQGIGATVQMADYRDHKDRTACQRNGCADIPECVMFGIITEPPLTTFCHHCAPRVRKLYIHPFDNRSPIWINR